MSAAYGRLLGEGWAIMKLPQEEAETLMLFLSGSDDSYPNGTSFMCSAESFEDGIRTIYLSPTSINRIPAWQKMFGR